VETVAVTAGVMCAEPREEFFRHIDAANVDLKAFTDRFYHKLCGSHLQPVLDTLLYLKKETNVWVELTTLLIPGENDSDAEIDEMTSWVVENLGADTPMHFTAFHPDWKMSDYPPTPAGTLVRACQIARRNGVRYAYTGNVHDETGGSTVCHSCGHVFTARDRYRLTTSDMGEEGKCKHCGTVCAGRFEDSPGDWGTKRLPVRLADYD